MYSRFRDNLSSQFVGVGVVSLCDELFYESLKNKYLTKRTLVYIQLILVGIRYDIPRTYTRHVCTGENLRDGGISYSTSGIVDDAAECFFVRRIDNNAEVSNDVLYLLALVETQSTINTIRNVLLAHRLLEGTALGIGAIKDGKVVPLTILTLPYFLYILAYDDCLLLVAICRLEHYLLAVAILAINVLGYLSLIVANEAVCRFNYMLRASIVALKFEQLCAVIHVAEIKDIVYVSTTETIDALGVIANHAYVLMLLCQQPHNTLLNGVCVLILVHKNILEPICIFLTDVLVVLQQLVSKQQQVVEVHSIRLPASLGVCKIYLIYIRHALFLVALKSTCIIRIVVCRNHVVLSHADAVV